MIRKDRMMQVAQHKTEKPRELQHTGFIFVV
jgi:hypothetical protein